MKNSRVSVLWVRQAGGSAALDLTRPVRYTVDVPGVGARTWTVTVTRVK